MNTGELKEKGNVAFKEKRYYSAIEHYTQSLQVQRDITVLGNRAQALLNLKCWDRALMDCNSALAVDSGNVKCLYRRALALEGLHLFTQAHNDASKCQTIVDDSAVRNLAKKLDGKKSDEVIVLLCCEKGDDIHSDDSFVDVPIECDEVVIQHDTIKEEVCEVENSVLPMVPTTFVDFVAHFTQLRKNPVDFARYFLMIPLNHYNSLFDDLLDYDAVSCLLSGFAELLQLDNVSILLIPVTQCLLRLTAIDRFEMVSIFLSAKDKQNIQSVCSHLSEPDGFAIMDKYS